MPAEIVSRPSRDTPWTSSNISELYAKINTHEDFTNHPKWVGRGVPDNLVLEIST